MAKTSKFVQLNDFILLEYEYEDLGNPSYISTQNAGFSKLINGHLNNQIQILNTDASIDLTGNVRDRSVVQIADNKYAHLDIDLPLNYINYDAQLTHSNITFAPNILIPYDRIIIHILSGYNLNTNVEGYVFKVETLSSGIVPQKVVWANQAWTSDDIHFNLNPNPIRIGQRMYDRYIDFKIPSLKWTNDQFYANTSNTNSFGYLTAPFNKGYNQFNPIYVTLYEIESTEVENRFRIFRTANEKETVITQEDEFDNLGAVLRESDEGDYYEYFATWEGKFIEDYIYFLNNKGGKWIVIHDLKLTEQVGVNMIETDNFNRIQHNSFGEPLIFRPVIKNAHIAFAYHLDYILRLFNQENGTQILRRASLSNYDVKKYGRELEQINLGYDPEIHKVYNQIKEGLIVQTPQIKLTPQVETKYVPSFFDFNSLNISNQTIYLDKDGKIVSENSKSETLYGQGQLELVLSPFDNLIKFKVYKKDDKGVHSFDLNNSNELQLVFNIATGNSKSKRLFIDEVKDSGSTNKVDGEIIFNITTEQVDQITQSKNFNWYLINKVNNTVKPIMRGKWTTVESDNEETALRKQINDLKRLVETEKSKHTSEVQTLSDNLTQAQKKFDEFKNKAIANIMNLRNKVKPTDVQLVSPDAIEKAKNNESGTGQEVRPVNTGTFQILNTAKNDPAVENSQKLKDILKPIFFRKGFIKIK